MENKRYAPNRLYRYKDSGVLMLYRVFPPRQKICLEQINPHPGSFGFPLKTQLSFSWPLEQPGYTGSMNRCHCANCHKLPLLPLPGSCLNLMRSSARTTPSCRNPEYQSGTYVVFTLSPVRHWKDGAVNNQKSKSITSLCNRYDCRPESQGSLFPAYEIFMDELRD